MSRALEQAAAQVEAAQSAMLMPGHGGPVQRMRESALRQAWAAYDAEAAEVVRLRAEIEALRTENETIRRASSAGYARGTIKQAPVREWTSSRDEEDML